jgi:hypothetical protein
MSAVGEKRLLPSPERSAIVVNCANSFVRDNQSWLLERLLRDHEGAAPVDDQTSLRIDVFELGTFTSTEEANPKLDFVWMIGVIVILTQFALAVIPLGVHRDWGPILVFSAGQALATITAALPQWKEEKWASRLLEKDNVTALTRGNGHRHVMIFVGARGSYNLEVMATASPQPRPETPMLTTILAALWICLLLTVSGLKNNAWFMVGIGGLGMLQNVYAAGKGRSTGTAGLKLKEFRRKPTIIGRRLDVPNAATADVDLVATSNDVAPLQAWLNGRAQGSVMPPWLESMSTVDGVPDWLRPAPEAGGIVRTHGALQELERWVPGAGLALLKIFFPGSLTYEDDTVRDNVNKQFWKKAWHTRAVRKKAEQARTLASAARERV